MADEILATTTLTMNNGSVVVDRSSSKRITQASARYVSSVQSIATTEALIVIPTGIVTPGCAVFTNTSATNFVELGIVVSSTFYPFVKLLPGESAQLRLGTATPYARANTAAIDLSYTILAN